MSALGMVFGFVVGVAANGTSDLMVKNVVMGVFTGLTRSVFRMNLVIIAAAIRTLGMIFALVLRTANGTNVSSYLTTSIGVLSRLLHRLRGTFFLGMVKASALSTNGMILCDMRVTAAI